MVALSWRSELSEVEVAQVRELLDTVTAVDTVAPVSEAFWLRIQPDGGGAQHLLARDRDGALAGYAQLAGTAEAELAVHPEHRRRGIGGQLLAALLGRAPGGRLRVWAHGEHIAAIALAERYGLSRDRVLLQLRRSLARPPLPEPVFPPGVRVRPFVPGQDEAAWLAVNGRAFAAHPEQGSWTLEDVLARQAEPWFDPAGFLLAVDTTDGDRVVGFHWTKVHDAAAGRGEVYVLGVDPSEHRRGLGSALTLAGLHYLRGRGVRTVLLYVEADNAAALRTYQRLGFTHWDTDACYRR